MQSKRDGLVPICEMLGELPAPLKPAKPQAVHHFTLSDQVDQLAAAREADPDTGFMARMMALCSLPRSNPGNQHQYKRVNGPYKLILSRTGEYKLPFGNLPRLLMAWVSTEAVRTQSRELVLGDSLSEFMRALGVYSNSGRVHTRLRNQMNRLFHSSVEFTQEYEQGNRFVASRVVDRGEFWWDPKRPDDRSLWDSKIRIGEDFFHEIIRHPVPLDINTLIALKRSSLGLDLYLWTAYRTFSLKRPMRLSWQQVYRQFGVDPSRASDRVTVDNFRKDCLRELKKIKLAWPELNYSLGKGVLMLSPSTPSITPVAASPRLAR